MQSHHLALSGHLKNVSNTVTSPVKKTKPAGAPVDPRTPPRGGGFITSSPVSGKRTTPNVRKQKPKLRPPRTPSGTIFSPSYPPAVGVNNFHQQDPATPTSSVEAYATLSPVQKSLQDNVRRYGHLPQEFDEYDCDEFDPYRFIATLPPLSPNFGDIYLPPKTVVAPVSLVLDLDETLVHCSTDADEIQNPDFVFQVEFQGTLYTVNCRKRPGLHEFLEYLKNRFEVIVFTASQKVYANKLLDILDPTNEIFHHRVFRDGCTNVEGTYLKDLSVLGRDLSTLAIIDNSPQAFAFHLDNGIPILSWFDSPADRELFKVIPLLDLLSEAPDVRPLLRQRFQLYQKVEAHALPPCPPLPEPFQRCLAETLEALA